MSQAKVSARPYLFTWIGLLGLTLLTSLIGLVDLGKFSLLLAVLIAMVKAGLVVAFFMHVLYESKLVAVVVAGGVIWFLILITITFGDYFTRGWLGFPGK